MTQRPKKPTGQTKKKTTKKVVKETAKKQKWDNIKPEQDTHKIAKKRQEIVRKRGKVPEGVVDMDAYEQYVKIRDSATLKDAEYFTSDDTCVVNLRSTTYQIKKKITHLPQEEQDLILTKSTVLRKVAGKMVHQKKKAFNIKQRGPYSMQESILDSKASELLEYFGRFFSSPEVHKIVTLEWGYEVNFATIDNFRKRHMDRIKEKQEEYKRDYSDVRLGHKRSRLDELQYLYSHRKAKYEITENKDDYKLLLQTIEQIRKEVEGDRLTVDGHLKMDVEHTVNSHIQNEMLKAVVINDIVVGRLSARVGIDPRVLINKLHNSYYAKFTGFQRPDTNIKDDVPIYPSKFVYNFDDLERQHKELEIQDAKILDSVPKLEEAEKVQFKTAKQLLIEKIKAKQQQISGSQGCVDKSK